MMTPVGRLILLQSFPRSDLMRAMAYMTLPAVVGPVIGPLLGGVLTTYLSWHWIFYMNVPFGLIGMALAIRYVKNVPAKEVARFDFIGFLMVGGGLGLMQFGLENVSHPIVAPWITVASLGFALALLVGFVVYARRTPSPVVDLSLIRDRAFRIGTLTGALCRIGLSGVPFLLPLMLQVGFGLSPIASGSITFIGAFGGLLIRNVMPSAVRRYGFRIVLVSSTVAGSLSVAGFALMEADTPHVYLMFWVFVFGLSRSAQFMASNALAYADLPERQLSCSTTLGGALQQLSMGLGVSVGAMLLALVSYNAETLTPPHFHYAFLLTAIIPLLSLPGFLSLTANDGAGMFGQKPTKTDVKG
jgi:MFS family permease